MEGKQLPNPFIYGKVVQAEHFFDRKKELTRLAQLMSGNNNILISGDRRVGKTSLLLYCCELVEKKGVSTFYINLDPITSSTSFIERYAALFTKHLSFSKHALHTLQAALHGFKFDVALDASGTPTASLAWNGSNKLQPDSLQQVLRLPQELARKYKKKFLICFDEFQTVCDLTDIDMIAEMRAEFQLHDHITYVFMGSETHLLHQLFSSPHEKFFNSSIKFHLDAIPRHEFVKFIEEQFSKRHVTLAPDAGAFICSWGNDIPAHIQHLCSCIWDFLPTQTKSITEDVISQAVASDIENRDQLYLQIWQSLGDPKDQLIVRHLAQETNLAISSAAFCHPLHMNPATVTRRLKKLVQRTRGAVIHIRSSAYVFSDPFFREWVKQKT